MGVPFYPTTQFVQPLTGQKKKEKKMHTTTQIRITCRNGRARMKEEKWG